MKTNEFCSYSTSLILGSYCQAQEVEIKTLVTNHTYRTGFSDLVRPTMAS